MEETMATLKKVQVTLELPADMARLSKDEVDSLKNIFKTEVANVLSSKVPESLLSIIIRNTKPGGGGGSGLMASKKSSKPRKAVAKKKKR
jgi:hypothetical protein